MAALFVIDETLEKLLATEWINKFTLTALIHSIIWMNLKVIVPKKKPYPPPKIRYMLYNYAYRKLVCGDG